MSETTNTKNPPSKLYTSFSALFEDDAYWGRLEAQRAEEDAVRAKWARRAKEDPMREDWTLGMTEMDEKMETEDEDGVFESNPIFEKATQLVWGLSPIVDPTVHAGVGDDAQDEYQNFLESLLFPHIIRVDSFGLAGPLSLYDLQAFEYPWEGLDIEHNVLMGREMNILEGSPPENFCPKAAAAMYLRSEGADINADLVAKGIAQVTTGWHASSKLLMCLDYKGYTSEGDRTICDRLVKALDGKAVAEPRSEDGDPFGRRDPDDRCSVLLLVSETNNKGESNPWFAPLKRALEEKDAKLRGTAKLCATLNRALRENPKLRGYSELQMMVDDPWETSDV